MLMDQSAPSARLRLENQVAVVTGGARGIGAGIVRRFVEEGARVVFSDLLNEKGKGLEEELGKNAAFYRADATSPSDTEALMKFAVEHFGRLDCVVNNAGAGGEGWTYLGSFGSRISTIAQSPPPRHILRNKILCPAFGKRVDHQYRQRSRLTAGYPVARVYSS